MIHTLYVLYDSSCPLCAWLARWMQSEASLVRLQFLPVRSPRAAQLFSTLDLSREELIAVSDEGGVYRDDDAWLMCLWATEEFRELSIRLNAPGLRTLARQAFLWLSRNRHGISCLLGLSNDEMGERLRGEYLPACPPPMPAAPLPTACRE